MKGVFVTGTDTGVGKTYASLALIAGWRSQGLRVGVMKPSETGLEVDGVLGPPQDAVQLLDASGADLTLDEVCPFRFNAPMAPAEAAALEGGGVCIDTVKKIYRSIEERHDITLVEGAGGLLVPFTEDMMAADLIKELGLPMILVARAGLGTINHTCLTIESAQARGLDVIGVIYSRAEDPAISPPGPDETRNAATIERITGVKTLAELPFATDSAEIVLPV